MHAGWGEVGGGAGGRQALVGGQAYCTIFLALRVDAKTKLVKYSAYRPSMMLSNLVP